jgi:hypothetical protein
MITTSLGVTLTLTLFGWGVAPAGWHNDYAQAHAHATSSDKPLFIVICSGSSEYRQLAALGVFLSDGLEKTLRADFVRLFIDSDTVGGKALAQQFEAGDKPHFVILDRSGRWQVYYKSGYLLEEDLSPVLRQFRRIRMSASGIPVREVIRQTVAQVCTT